MSDAGEPLRYPSDDCIEAYGTGMAIKRLQMMLGFALGETSEFDNPPLETESAVESELASFDRAFKSFHAGLTDDKHVDYERSARAFFRMQQQLGRRLSRTRYERPDENAAMLSELWKAVDDLEIGIHSILANQNGDAIRWFDLGLEICHIEVQLSKPTSYYLAANPRPWPNDVDSALGQWYWKNPARVRALFDELCPGQNFPSCPGSDEPLPLPFTGLHDNDAYHELWLELLIGSQLLHPPCTDLERQEKAPIRKKQDRRSEARHYGYLDLATDGDSFLVSRKGCDETADFSRRKLPWEVFRIFLKNESTLLSNEALHPAWVKAGNMKVPKPRNVNDCIGKINELLKPLGIEVVYFSGSRTRRLEAISSS